VTLKDEHRLRVFENRVFRRIFGPKRDKVTGGWRKLHNEELHKLYSSPSIIRMIKSRRRRGAWYVARMGARRNAYRILLRSLGSRDRGFEFHSGHGCLVFVCVCFSVFLYR
jgi:hypothetical protein